jgi:hypothetical protein
MVNVGKLVDQTSRLANMVILTFFILENLKYFWGGRRYKGDKGGPTLRLQGYRGPVSLALLRSLDRSGGPRHGGPDGTFALLQGGS